MKICCVADLHIGVKAYGKTDVETKFNTRELDAINAFKKVVSYCKDNHITKMIIAGDVYDRQLSSPTLQHEVNKILYDIASSGITLYLLDGNHDLGKLPNSKSALAAVDAFNIDNVYHTSNFLEVPLDNKINICLLPTYGTAEEYDKLLSALDENKQYIVVGHFCIKGSKLRASMIANELHNIPIDIFDKPNIKAVVMGHLHLRQMLKAEPRIFYCGSLFQVDFGEEGQEKGFCILDTDTYKVEFIPVDSPQFCTLDIMKYKDETIDFTNKNTLNNKIVRVNINTDATHKLSAEETKELYNHLEKLGCYSANIKQNIDADARIRNTKLTEDISLSKALEMYYSNKERANERIQLGKEIISEILIAGT